MPFDAGQQPGDLGLVWCCASWRRPRRAALEHCMPATLRSTSSPSRLLARARARGHVQAGVPEARCTATPFEEFEEPATCAAAQYDDVWKRRDVLGVHPQKQAGFVWVGCCVPAGRLFAADLREFARIAEECALARPAACLSLWSPCVAARGTQARRKRRCTSVTATCGAACRLGYRLLTQERKCASCGGCTCGMLWHVMLKVGSGLTPYLMGRLLRAGTATGPSG